MMSFDKLHFARNYQACLQILGMLIKRLYFSAVYDIEKQSAAKRNRIVNQ